MIVISKVDEVYLSLRPVDKKGFRDIESLQTRFSFFSEGYSQTTQFKAGRWDGKESFIRHVKTDIYVFTTGLFRDFQVYCECMGIETRWSGEELFSTGFDLDPDLFIEHLSLPDSIKVREYQKKYFYKAMSQGRSCLIAPTGSGKTLITHLMCEALHRILLDEDECVLVMVPRVDLVKQTAKKFRQYGCSYQVREIYGGQERDHSRVVVSTWQSLFRMPEEWFAKFGAIIIDECHTAAAENVRYVAHCCKNARIRTGMTGTLKDDVLFKHLVQAYLGPTYQAVSTMELVAMGFLSPLLIKNIVLDWKLGRGKYLTTLNWQEQQKTILTNEPRFEKVIDLVKMVRAKSVGTTMVLGNRVEYLRALNKRLVKEYEGKDNVMYITGTDVDSKKRTPLLDECEKNGGILVANLDIVGTGTDIPNVDTIIIVTPVKAKIALLQLIGRGVRLSPGKKMLEVYDVTDHFRMLKEDGTSTDNRSFAHLELKRAILENESFVSRVYTMPLEM